jgi:hypothetical protein
MSGDDHDFKALEAELQRARPASPPSDFLQRLMLEPPRQVAAGRQKNAAQTHPVCSQRLSRTGFPDSIAWIAWVRRWLWWTAATAGLALLGAVAWQAGRHGVHGTALKADDVQIDRHLVSTFDTVAPLPSGEPVRFRCEEWMDEVVLRDSKRGIEVARRVPRIELVPVRFEIY